MDWVLVDFIHFAKYIKYITIIVSLRERLSIEYSVERFWLYVALCAHVNEFLRTLFRLFPLLFLLFPHVFYALWHLGVSEWVDEKLHGELLNDMILL